MKKYVVRVLAAGIASVMLVCNVQVRMPETKMTEYGKMTDLSFNAASAEGTETTQAAEVKGDAVHGRHGNKDKNPLDDKSGNN